MDQTLNPNETLNRKTLNSKPLGGLHLGPKVVPLGLGDAFQRSLRQYQEFMKGILEGYNLRGTSLNPLKTLKP